MNTELSGMTYSELLDQVGKYELQKERLENLIHDITVEMKKRRVALMQDRCLPKALVPTTE